MMAERAGAAALGTATAATAVLPQPVIWHVLGYHFEAGAMIAGLFAAVVTRVLIEARRPGGSRTITWAVLALVLMTTAVVVISMQTNALGGLLYGTGLATIGEGLIRIAEKYTNKGLAVLGIESEPDVPAVSMPVRSPTGTPDAADIERLTGELHKHD